MFCNLRLSTDATSDTQHRQARAGEIASWFEIAEQTNQGQHQPMSMRQNICQPQNKPRLELAYSCIWQVSGKYLPHRRQTEIRIVSKFSTSYISNKDKLLRS